MKPTTGKVRTGGIAHSALVVLAFVAIAACTADQSGDTGAPPPIAAAPAPSVGDAAPESTTSIPSSAPTTTTRPPDTAGPAGGDTPPPTPSSQPAIAPEVTVVRNLAVPGGLSVDVYGPAGDGPWPVAVTVHGGSWLSGDRSSMAGFALELARTGVVVFNAEYSPLDKGGVFPLMFEEITCAVAFAQENAAAYGGGETTALVGYSAGAHIGAVVALAPEEFSDGCAGVPNPVDAFVGISGPYDSDQFPFLALQFGGLLRDVPEAWEAGNPYTYLGRNTDMAVLLLHGGNDPVVAPAFSEAFYTTLGQRGYDVAHEVFEDVGHFSITNVEENGLPTVTVTADHLRHHLATA